MSKIVITKNSLLNSIIENSQMIIGYAGVNSSLSSCESGSFTQGYADRFGYMIANGKGAHAEGYAENTNYKYSYSELKYGDYDFSLKEVSPSILIGDGEATIIYNYPFNNGGEAVQFWNDNVGNILHCLEFDVLSLEVSYDKYIQWFSCIDYIGYNIIPKDIIVGTFTDTKYFISIEYKINKSDIAIGKKKTLCKPHRELKCSYIDASGNGAHAEGCASTGGYINASGNGAHAEGYALDINSYIIANGNGAHAEGIATLAIGEAAHAEGAVCFAHHNYSHAGGLRTKTDAECQTVIGKYNANTNGETLFVVGNGTNIDESARHNAFEVYENGSYRSNSIVDVSNGLSDYASLFFNAISLTTKYYLEIKKYTQKINITELKTSTGDNCYMFFNSNIYKPYDEIIVINYTKGLQGDQKNIRIYGYFNSNTATDTSTLTLGSGQAAKLLFTNDTDTFIIHGTTTTISYRKFLYTVYDGFIKTSGSAQLT